MTQDYFMTLLGMDGLLEKEEWEKEPYPEETMEASPSMAEQDETDEEDWEEMEIPDLGEWGRLRMLYIQGEKPKLWKELLRNGEAETYLKKYQQEMEERETKYRAQMEEQENVWAIPDFMEQVRKRNRIAAIAREYIQEEICQ